MLDRPQSTDRTSSPPVPGVGAALRQLEPQQASLAEVWDWLEPLLRRADHLLYAAKLAGRNCVMADRPPASPDVALAAD